MIVSNSGIMFIIGSWKINIFLSRVSDKTKGVYCIIFPISFGIASIDIIMLEDIRKRMPAQTDAMTPVSSELKIWPMIAPIIIKKELIIIVDKAVKYRGSIIFELKNNLETDKMIRI